MKLIIESYNKILIRSEKKKILLLFVLFFITALTELFGLASASAIIYLLVNKQSFLIEKIIFSSLSYYEIVNVMCLILIFVYLTKSIINYYVILYQSKIFLEIQDRLSNKLLNSYLSKNYSFFFTRNKGQLAFNISQEIENICSRLINPIFNLFFELITLCFIITFLILKFIYTFYIFTALLSFYFIFFKLTKKKISQAGEKRRVNDSIKAKILKDIFGGIKQIKLLRIEDYFIKKFTYLNKRSNEGFQQSNIIGSLPKIIFELTAITFVALTILYFVYLDNLNKITAYLAIFLMIIIKTLPALNKIIVALNSIKFTLPALKKIFDDLNEDFLDKINNTRIEDINFDFKYKIKFENLSFNYYPNKFVLNKINLEIKKNDFIGIYGPSGSGKSTLVDIITGISTMTSGKIFVDEIEIFNYAKLNKKIGYLNQETFLFDDTLINNIALGIDKEKINKTNLNIAIELAEIKKFANDLPDKLETIIGENGIKLSGGEKQRIGISRLLYFDYQILIFDEPTNALDNKTEEKIMETINRIKNLKTIILISHKMQNLHKCDNIYEIKDTLLIKKL
jgi:ATP-binding cassette subfamily C protein